MTDPTPHDDGDTFGAADWRDPRTRARTVPEGTPAFCDVHFVVRNVPTADFCEERLGRPGVVYLKEEVSGGILNAIEVSLGPGYELVIDIQFPPQDIVDAPTGP